MPSADRDSNLNLVIYYNDCIDSDNITAALALLRDTQRKAAASPAGAAGTRIVWILEPRQVALGLGMSKAQMDECKALIAQHFPDRGMPFKVLLGGLLEDEDIESVRHALTLSQLAVLRKAVRPAYGPRGDAELHALLMGWDFANSLSDWALAPVRVLIDYESLDELQNPVNLNVHFHEELVGRYQEEISDYQAIIEEEDADADADTDDAEGTGAERTLGRRVDRLRDWYRECITKASEITNERDSRVDRLNFKELCRTIRAAGSVRFLGGSSLRILRRFIDEGIADRIQCHLQVGSCDMSGNLFSNQFNIALNPGAAQFVLDNFTRFIRFTVVPSHSAQAVKYMLTGLARVGGAHLERRILGFNCHEEPRRIASNETSLQADYETKASPMPDLTSFMCELQPGFMGSTPGYVRLVHDGSTLLFKRVEGEDAGGQGAIPMCDIRAVRELEAWEVEQIWKLLKGWF